MERIDTYNDLVILEKKYRPQLDSRSYFESNAVMNTSKKEVLICGGSGCHWAKSDQIKDLLDAEIKKAGLSDRVTTSITGCFGFCAKGPIIKIFPDDVFYVQVHPEDVREIVYSHLVAGNVIQRLLFHEPTKDESVKRQKDISFYKKQMRIVLRNCGIINPESIEEYIASGGYSALGKVLSSLSPSEAIGIIKDSKLRGRGGAGFPTGMKWEAARNYESDIKYMVCNADEGDPGAFMDRSILEGDPHSIIEAMAIGGYCIGSSQGYIYIRSEYPIAIRRLETAIDQAKEAGLVGKNILGSDFDFEIEIKYGSGAFVCGEETALVKSIEGERAEPRFKPPSSTEVGLWQKPTCINNVETLANIPVIINRGASFFSSIGSKSSPGTKVFALAGKVENVGLIEVPMGTTLMDIIFDIGGGIQGGKCFKAVQMGGPLGGFLPEKLLDISLDYESLASIGSMMGSGGILVLDEDDCMIDIAKYFLGFSVKESCGKCVPCRIGNKRLHEILDRISKGEGNIEDINTLKDLGDTMHEISLCGFGQSSPNPVLSSIKYFPEEYDEHISDKKCRAGSCPALLDFFISDDCIGCTICAKLCPVHAIFGRVKQVHVIDQEACINCGVCMESCPVNAVIKK